MAVDDDGEFGYRPMFAALLDALDELRGAGLVTAEEIHRMCVPVVGRKAADFFTPFAPSGRFEQLEIDHLEVFDAEDRFWSQYQIDNDEKAFGEQWASFVRASVFPTLATALDGGVADARTAQFLDQLEAGVAARLAAAPEQMQIPLAHLVLIKRPKAEVTSDCESVSDWASCHSRSPSRSIVVAEVIRLLGRSFTKYCPASGSGVRPDGPSVARRHPRCREMAPPVSSTQFRWCRGSGRSRWP